MIDVPSNKESVLENPVTDETSLNDNDLDTLARIFDVLAQWDFEEKQKASNPDNGSAP